MHCHKYYDLNNSGNLSYLSTEEETTTITSALNKNTNNANTSKKVVETQQFVQHKNQTSNTSPSASTHNAASGKSKGAKEGPSVETLHLHIEGKVELTREYLEGGNKGEEQSKVQIGNFSKNSSTTGIDSENLEANPIETDAAAVSSSHEE